MLRGDLTRVGLNVWHDCKDIQPGDSISQKVSDGLARSDYFILIISRASVSSKWVALEYGAALARKIATGKPRIIPVRIGSVEPPVLLRDIKWVDFFPDYRTGCKELTRIFASGVAADGVHPIRLGGATGTGIVVLRAFIKKLHAALPRLPLRITDEPSDRLTEQVARDSDNALEAAVVGAIPAERHQGKIEQVEVFRQKSALVVPPGHALWGKEVISESKLRQVLKPGVEFAGRPKDSGTYKANLKYLRPILGNAAAKAILSENAMDRIDAVMEAIRRGKVISILPSVVVKLAVARGEVWAVELPGDTTRIWYGIWNKNRQHFPGVTELVALFKQGLAPEEVDILQHSCN